MDEEQYFQQFDMSGMTPDQQKLFKTVMWGAATYTPGMANNVTGEEEGERPLSSYSSDVQSLIRDYRFQDLFGQATNEQYAKILRDAGISSEEWFANNPEGEDETPYALKVLRAANYNGINESESFYSNPENIASEEDRDKALEELREEAMRSFEDSYLFPDLGGRLNEIVPEEIRNSPEKMRDFELAFRGQFGIGLDFDESGRVGDLYTDNVFGNAFRQGVKYPVMRLAAATQKMALDYGVAAVDILRGDEGLSQEARDLKFRISQQEGKDETYLESAGASATSPSLFYAALFSPEARRQLLETSAPPDRTRDIEQLLEDPSGVGVVNGIGIAVDMLIDSAPIIAEIGLSMTGAGALLKGGTKAIAKKAAKKAAKETLYDPATIARTGVLKDAAAAAEKARKIQSRAASLSGALNKTGGFLLADVLVASHVHADNSSEDWYKNLDGAERAWFLANQSSAEVASGMVLGGILGGKGIISKASQALYKGQKKAVNSFAKGVIESTFFGIAEEGVTEGITAGWQYFSEIEARKNGGDSTAVFDQKEFIKRVKDGAIAGALMGGVAGFGGGAVRGAAKAAISKFHPEVQTLKKELDEVAQAMDNAVTEEQKTQAKESLQEIVSRYAGAQSSVTRAYVKLAEANPETFEELARIQGKINAEVTRYQAGDYSSSEKSNARKRVKRLVQKKNDLQNKVISESTAEGLADLTSFDDLVRLEAEAVAQERGFKFKQWKESPLTTTTQQTTALLKEEREAMSASLEAAQVVNSQEQNADDDLQDSEGQTQEDSGMVRDEEAPIEGVEGTADKPMNPNALDGQPLADKYRDLTEKMNNLLKAFKPLGINAVVHTTEQSFFNATGSTALGVFRRGKTVHINLEQKGATANTVRHEFLHAAFTTVTAQKKQQFLEELRGISGINARNIEDAVEKTYKNYGPEALIEEKIVNILERALDNPALEADQSIIQRILNAFRRMLGVKEQITESDLQGFVRQFRAAERTGARFEGQQVGQSADMEAREFGVRQPSKAYPDLINKVVNYRVYYLDKLGGQQSYQTNGLRFNDYWHFRNWYLKETGNGKMANNIGSFTYTGDDGTLKKINPPKPKRDRETGEIIDMEPRLKTPQQRKMDTAQSQQLRRKRFLRYVDIRRNAGTALKFAVGKVKKIGRTGELTFYNDRMQLEQESQSELPVAYSETFFTDGLNVDELDQLGADFGNNLEFLIPTTQEADFAFTVRNNGDGTVTIDAHSDFIPIDKRGEGDTIAQGTTNIPENLEARKLEIKGSRFLGKEANRGDMLEDTKGTRAMGVGFDQTGDKSGVADLVRRGVSLISAHIDRAKAEAIEGVMVRMALEEVKAKNMKDGDIGYITMYQTLLEEESSLGNPLVFADVLTGTYRGRNQENRRFISRQTIEEFLNSKFLKDEAFKKRIRAMLEGGNNLEEVFDAIKLGETVRLTEEQFDEITDLLAKNARSLSFEQRTEMAKSFLRGRSFVKDRVFEKHNDATWKDGKVEKGEVVAYTVVPFRYNANGKNERAKIEGFTSRSDATVKGKAAKDNPFQGLIVPAAVVDGKMVVGAKLKDRDGNEVPLPETKIPTNAYHIREVFGGKVQKQVKDKEDKGRFVDEDVDLTGLSVEEQVKELNKRVAIGVRGISFDPDNFTATITETETKKEGVEKKESRPLGLNTDNESSLPFEPNRLNGFQAFMARVDQLFANKYANVFSLQRAIEGAKKAVVDISQDFINAETLMYGKTANDLEKLDEKVKVISQEMKDAGLIGEDVSQFLIARHAEERNALIAERTDGETLSGSGMSNERAQEVMDSFSPEKKAALESIAKKVDAITKDTRQTMVKFGLESQETIDAFEAMFDNYVPLGGLSADEMSADTSLYPTGGAGMSIYGDTTRRAKGRASEANNVLAQAIAQNAAVHAKARKNEALSSLYNLVEANPNTKVWRISSEVPFDAQSAVGVRVNGDQKFIVFTNADHAKALKNMGVEKLDLFSKVMRSFSGFLRRSFTTANPEFIISNFARDIQSALFNAMAEADIPGGQIQSKYIATKIIERVKQTLPALLKGAVGKDLDPEMAAYFEEFKEDGGQTGWGFVKDVGTIAAEIEAEVNEKNRAQRARDWMMKNSIDVVENVNDAFENSIRLAAYMEARKAGASREKAAELAKNITVNFNRSGELGAVANAWYMFFNASVQGTVRLARSLGTLKDVRKPNGELESWHNRLNAAQKMAFGLSLTTGMLTAINLAMSDEDEDGVLFYNKIPDYEKERNLIIMYDGKNYLKIPLPYGFNVFANMGSAMAEAAGGHREPEDAGMFLLNSAFSSFSPISFGQSKDAAKYLAKGATPTIFKPLVDIAVNESYFGSSVYKEQFPVGAPKPEAEMSFRSPEGVRKFFQWMNEATGGSEFVPGKADFNPDKFWYGFEYYIGGAGQFVTRTLGTGRDTYEMIKEGEKVPMKANDFPFLRKVYGEFSKYYDSDVYVENTNLVSQLYKERKEAENKNDKRYRGIMKLESARKKTEKQIKRLRQLRKEARDIKNYVERQNRIYELYEKERSLLMEFNKQFETLRGQD